jgi:8-oxo-dGTP pyrophosphatase MutT (NUDIX family)
MVGAGVLPAALHKGCVYLLFGKENELNDTPGWADFGGGAEPNETILDAAAREGSEELNGLLGSKRHMKQLATKRKIATLNYQNRYTTIVFKTHYDERLETYYLNNYQFFEKHLPNVKADPNNGLLEKSEIRWFTFAELRKSKSIFRPFYRNMLELILKNEDVITKNLLKMKCGTRCSSGRTKRSSGTKRRSKSKKSKSRTARRNRS